MSPAPTMDFFLKLTPIWYESPPNAASLALLSRHSPPLVPEWTRPGEVSTPPEAASERVTGQTARGRGEGWL